MGVSALAASIFAFAALGSKAIGQLRLFEQTWPIHEEIIDRDHPWLGMELGDLWEDRTRMLIYYLPFRGEIELVSAIEQEYRLRQGDRLIIGDRPNIRKPKSTRRQKLLKAIANLPKYRRYIRPVFLVSLSLIFTILVATITYVSFNHNTSVSVVDALYFSIGTITGAGSDRA
jgi:hypothetical protein